MIRNGIRSYKFILFFLCITIIMNATGCVTFFNVMGMEEKKSQISITTTPSGANLTILDKAGQPIDLGAKRLEGDTWQKLITPTTIMMQNNYDSIKLDMTGYPSQTKKLEKNKFNPFFLINFGWAGLGIYFLTDTYKEGDKKPSSQTGETYTAYEADRLNTNNKNTAIGLFIASAACAIVDMFMGGHKTYSNSMTIDMNKRSYSSPSYPVTSSFNTTSQNQLTGNAIEQVLSNAIQRSTASISKNSVIAVIPVTTNNNILREFITGETEFLLVGQGFRVVDRGQLDRIRREQRFQSSGEVDDRTAISLGKFSGADYIVTGRISGEGSTQRLRMQLLDVQTAELSGTASVDFGESQPLSNPAGLEDAVRTAVQQATAKVSKNAKMAIVDVLSGSNADFIRGESEYTLVNQGFRVVDRGQLDRIRQEQGIQASWEVDDRTAVNIGRLAGAEYLITIRADGQGGLTRLRWRILSTQTALVTGVASVPYQGTSSRGTVLSLENALTSAIDQATTKVTKDTRIAVVQITTTNTSHRDYVMGESGHILVNKGFRVVNRNEIDRIRNEQRIQYSGEVDDKTTVDIGKLAGAKYIITGRIDGTGNLQRLRLRVLDTETAEVVGVSSVRF